MNMGHNFDTFGSAIPTDRLSNFNYNFQAPFSLNTYAASSEILTFSENLARHLITRAMALSDLNKILD